MRIHCDISGYYDWVPVPDGVKVTEEDEKALRVKLMADGKWHMKVTRKVGEIAPDKRHFDAGIPETMIAEQVAIRYTLGKDETREEFVAMHLKHLLPHHLHRSHLVKIEVHDDGPALEMFRAELEKAGVTEARRMEEAIALYATEVDMGRYLNAVFHTASFREGGK